MANALATLRAAREAEGRARMTHEAWAPPEELGRARKWLTGPVATDDYGNEIPGDSSSLLSMLNSLTPHPGQSEEQISENTLGFLLPSGGIGAARDLARGPVGESVLRIFAGPSAKTAARRAGKAANAVSDGEGLARAADQGYLLDEPMYRGSNALTEVFDPARRGASTGRMSAKVADWTHSREDAAGGFADLAASKMGGKPIVQKLIPHREGFVEMDLSKGNVSDEELAHWLLDQKDQGTRVVKITGVSDSVGGGKPGPVYAILDQGAVRDVNAKFDPKLKGQPGLLKALAALGASIPLVGSIEGTERTDLPR